MAVDIRHAIQHDQIEAVAGKNRPAMDAWVDGKVTGEAPRGAGLLFITDETLFERVSEPDLEPADEPEAPEKPPVEPPGITRPDVAPRSREDFIGGWEETLTPPWLGAGPG